MLHNQQHKWNVENQDNPNCIRDSACIYRFCCHASKIIKNSALIRLTILRGCEKSPLKVKRTLSGMKPGGVLFFVVKLSYYE